MLSEHRFRLNLGSVVRVHKSGKPRRRCAARPLQPKVRSRFSIYHELHHWRLVSLDENGNGVKHIPKR